jgi:hypothetical protein
LLECYWDVFSINFRDVVSLQIGVRDEELIQALDRERNELEVQVIGSKKMKGGGETGSPNVGVDGIKLPTMRNTLPAHPWGLPFWRTVLHIRKKGEVM